MGGFFLLRSTIGYVNNSYGNIFSGSGKIKYAKAAESSGINGFGWYLQIKSTAEKGVFTFGNNSPIKSVEKTNLYDFLLYLSACSAENKYQQKLSEHDS